MATDDWKSLAEIYHHVLAQSPSPEAAKMAISAAWEENRLRLHCELRVHRKQPREIQTLLSSRLAYIKQLETKPEAGEELRKGFNEGLRRIDGLLKEKGVRIDCGGPVFPPEITPDRQLLSTDTFNTWHWLYSRATGHTADGTHFEYFNIAGYWSDVLALWPTQPVQAGGRKRGPKPKHPYDEIVAEFVRLIYEEGHPTHNDSELADTLLEFYQREFSVELDDPSALRHKVGIWLSRIKRTRPERAYRKKMKE